MSPLVKLEEALEGFIHLGGLMKSERDRRFVVRLLFRHFYEPSYAASQELSSSGFDKSYPNWAQLIRQLFGQEGLKNLTTNNEDFSISVVKETLNWAKKTYFQFEAQHAFSDEQNLLESLAKNPQRSPEEKWQESLEKLQDWYPENDQNWSFYKTRMATFHEALVHQEDILTRQNLLILQQNVLSDWRRCLRLKKETSEKDFLENVAFTYLNGLEEKAKKLLAFGDLLSPFYNFLGQAWNESMESWNSINWGKLETYAERFKKDHQLKELADYLGKWQLEERYKEEEQFQDTEFQTQWKPNPIGKSEVIGVHHSDELSALLPSEIALLSNAATEVVFSKKFVEKKLLTFQYRSRDMSSQNQKEEEKMMDSPTEDHGPFILCIDTSGSMFGKPERIAKALALAITEIAIQQKRKVYLISFSTGIQTLELTGKEKQFDKVIAFLMMSFHGGTDMKPALEEAMDMLETEAFKGADVLVISDFVISSLDAALLERVEKTRKLQGTHFHSLYIARKPDPNIAPLALFDHHWLYDLDNPAVIRQTIDHFEKLKSTDPEWEI